MSGCARRPPAAEARVARGCRAVRYGSGDSSIAPEQPVRARQRPHRLDQLLAHPRGDEARERALAVGHAERRVARARQLARRVHEALQHRLDLALGGDRQHGVAHRPHRAASALVIERHDRARPGAPHRALEPGPRRQPWAGFGQGSPRQRISAPARPSSTDPAGDPGQRRRSRRPLGLVGRARRRSGASDRPAACPAGKGASPRVTRR